MTNPGAWGRTIYHFPFIICHFQKTADYAESPELKLAPLYGPLGCQIEGFRDDFLNPLLKPLHLPFALAEQVQNAPADARPLLAVEHRLDQPLTNLFIGVSGQIIRGSDANIVVVIHEE